MPAPVARALSGRSDNRIIMPLTPTHPRVGRLPALSPALGERRFTVCVLQGCVMRVMYHEVNLATVRVLQRLGCDVVCPPDLSCCGALDLHAGLHDAGRERARTFLAALQTHTFDFLVVNSAGCGSTLREYREILADDPIWSAAAEGLSARVRDVSEFIWGDALQTDQSPLQSARFDATVTYHDACHLAHGQGVTEAPRRLLQAVPGIRVVDLPESDMCCGSAGTYNLTQPEMARRLLDRKVANIVSTGAEVVAMGNPGCMAWTETGLRLAGVNVRVMHTIEILDAALGRGLPSSDR
jgi:glycolate oxidase iron-sulfur subunit